MNVSQFRTAQATIMQRTISLIGLGMLIPSLSLSQQRDFEGQVVYTQTISSKTTKLSGESLINYFGDTIIVTIKDGNYRHKMLNASGVTDIIYLASQNRWYYKLAGVDTLYFTDCAVDDSKVLEIVKQTDTIEIAGFNCHIMTIKTTQSINTFYYADSLFKDPKYFAHHNLGNYNVYINETKSIYLKEIISSDLFDSELIAVQVIQKPILDDEFTLPSLPVAKK